MQTGEVFRPAMALRGQQVEDMEPKSTKNIDSERVNTPALTLHSHRQKVWNQNLLGH
jgi:hypothetical protein